MALEIFTSNNLNTLALTFANYCKAARKDAFEPDVVLVQSIGMQRWLSMQISSYCGICANMRFLFPNNFFGEIIDALFEPPEVALQKSSRDAAVWRLMQELPNLKDQEVFSFINRYLADDQLGLKLFQLSQKLADLYDQYALFRPLWVKSWDKASPEQLQSFAAYTFKDNAQLQKAYVWQALLWRRALRGQTEVYLWPFLLDKLQGKLLDPLCAARLPREAFVFGLSYLPPLYVELLQKISQRMDIYLFMQNPCAKYWGDAVTKHGERAIKREAVEQYAALSPAEIAERMHVDGGNRLLANWGGLGRQLLQTLWELDLPTQENFTLPGYDSMLHVLQSDILTLTNRGRCQNAADSLFALNEEPMAFAVSDRSVQVHICHTPLREIEVLHDNLLDMLAQAPDLKPEDIVVIAPDINTYEPYINAVFLSRTQNNCRLSFSISDRLLFKQGLMAAVEMVLEINKTRFEADKVLSLLEIEAVRHSFGIEAQDLPQLEIWLKNAGIRWGLDGAHKGATVNIKYPREKVDYAENTWRYGLERLLLTCAMPGFMYDDAYEGVLSTAEMDYDKKPLLGGLLNFIESLNYFHTEFSLPHTPEQWQTLLLRFLDTFFKDEIFSAEKDRFHKALQHMAVYGELGGFTGTLHLEVVRRFLAAKLESGDFERGFLSQGITFCSAKPMRSIPFKVVCFLGMDLENFPAKEHNASFDLIAKNRRRGDRSKRLDDKYLFLEALISAGDIFYVSYTGHNSGDNSVIQPSVLVSELLETADSTFLPLGTTAPAAHIITRHKMHAFDSAYFNGKNERYFSYNRENFAIAQGGGRLRTSFIGAEHALNTAETQLLTEVSPYEFADFFLNPAKAYLKKRLNINLDTDKDEVSNKEPFELKGLEAYAAQREMLDMMLANRLPEQIMQRLKQSGRLPHGNLAPKVFSAFYAKLTPFAERLRGFIDTEIGAHKPYTENIGVYSGNLHIKGPLPALCLPTGDHRHPVKLCFFSYSNDKAEHKLKAWLYHVLACAAGLSDSMLFLDGEQMLEFGPLADAETLLEELSAFYWRGFENPLAFFPKTGLEYARLCHAGNKSAEGACLNKWRDNDFVGIIGENADSYVRLCFREEHGAEIPPDFYANAREICLPLFNNLQQNNRKEEA